MPRAISWRLLALAGVILCALALWQYIEMRRFQTEESRRLELALRENVPPTDAAPRGDGERAIDPKSAEVPAMPSDRVPNDAAPLQKATGALLGRIEIPRLNLSAIVLEGSDERTLRLGVGRVPRTAEPGAAGNVVLGGHRDTFFRPLRGIRQGDEINLTTPQGTYRYTVDWTEVVDPNNVEPLKATPEPSLTLVTCYPFHYIGPAPQRFIVRARQEDSTSAAARMPAESKSQMKPAPLRARVVVVSHRPSKPRVAAAKVRPSRWRRAPRKIRRETRRALRNSPYRS